MRFKTGFALCSVENSFIGEHASTWGGEAKMYCFQLEEVHMCDISATLALVGAGPSLPRTLARSLRAR